MKRGSLMRLSFLHCEARCVLCISGLVRDTGGVRRGPLRGWGGREGKAAGSTLQAKHAPGFSRPRVLPRPQ